VAGTGGNTGIMFSRELRNTGFSVVVVTHNVGFGDPNTMTVRRRPAKRSGPWALRFTRERY
jgi:hypothetical protein